MCKFRKLIYKTYNEQGSVAAVSRPFDGFAVTYECTLGTQKYTEIYAMQVFSSASGTYLTDGDRIYNDADLTSPVSIPGYLFKTNSDLYFNVYDVVDGLLVYQGRSEGTC